MRPNAFAALRDLGLSHPYVYSRQEVSLSPPNTLFYLRHLAPGLTSETLRREELTELLITSDSPDPSNIQIEEYVLSSFGGCAVVSAGGIYIELVLGHLSGLLRRADCHFRFFLSPTSTSYRSVPGKTLTLQSRADLHVQAAPQLPAQSFLPWAQQASSLLSAVPTSHLFEFIVSSTGRLLFVDFKEYPWQIKFDALLRGDPASLYEAKPQLRGTPREFEAALHLSNLPDSPEPLAITLGNHALLSHFITYALDRRIVSSLEL